MDQTSLFNPKNTTPSKKDQEKICQSPASHNYIELRKTLKQLKNENKKLSQNFLKTTQLNNNLQTRINDLQTQVKRLQIINKELIQQNLQQHKQIDKYAPPQQSLKIKQCISNIDENFLQSLVELDQNILQRQRTSTKQLLKLQQIAGDLNQSILDQKQQSMLLNSDQSERKPVNSRQLYNFKEIKGFKSMITPLKPSHSQLVVKLKPTGPKNIKITKPQIIERHPTHPIDEDVRDKRKLQQKISYLLESNSALHSEIQRLKQENYLLKDQNTQKESLIINKRYEASELIKELNEAKNILQYFSHKMSNNQNFYNESSDDRQEIVSKFSRSYLMPATITQKNIFKDQKSIKPQTRNNIAKEISHKMKQVFEKKQNLCTSKLRT